jgi:hypothetical protein
MKREARVLLEKSCDSLILSIELFNRPNDVGRVTTTLILMDHAFEMLMKAVIVNRGGRIREKRVSETIGFDKCIRIGISDNRVKFLSEEQALTLQGINILRDAAQHHILDISENQFYIQVQSCLTLFRDLLKDIFNRELCEILPNRVLPLSTTAPVELDVLFENEIDEVKKLLKPGSRKRLAAHAKLRPLVLLDLSIRGVKKLPSANKVNRIGTELISGRQWQDIFPGVSSIEISATGSGQNLALRWTKKEGIPIHTVPEGTPGAAVVAIKRVNELDFYSLSLTQVAKKVELTRPKAIALVRYLDIQNNEDYFKKITIGESEFKQYSQNAVKLISDTLPKISLKEIWKAYGVKHRKEKDDQ